MRILHTSDWHLGKRLFKLDRSEEHALFLDWLIQVIKDERIDLLLIAGDIFDSPTPPHQALEMYYNFLHRMSQETKAETLIIAGNHDGGLLLDAPAKILFSHRVRVWGKLSKNPEDHWLKIKNIELCALPFFRSYELLPEGNEDALEALKRYLFFKNKIDCPQILLMHHLAGVYEAAGSEQVISLSGVDSIPAELLENFDYVALGHIHKPQKISSKSFYSGSPLPLRFSERMNKSVMIIEEKEGKLIESVKGIPTFRDIICLKTSEDSIFDDIKKLNPQSPLKGMVEIQLELTAPRPGIIDDIKKELEGRGFELLSFRPIFEEIEASSRKAEQIFKLSPIEIFKNFYFTKYPESQSIPEELVQDFKLLLEKVKYATDQA